MPRADIQMARPNAMLDLKKLMVGVDGLHVTGPDKKSTHTSVVYRVFGKEITNYGFNRLVRSHLNWKAWLPLSVEIHHGWYIRQAPRQADIKKHIPAILVFNSRQADAWRKESQTPVYVLGAPFVHFRRKANIVPAPHAQGTIVFPVHSGTVVDAEFDIEKYCNQLLALPAEFHPVNVCLHEDDIKRGRHIAYLERGFVVYCAGARLNPDFARNFYAILAAHKYSSSNGPGSYVLYSVEMGVPFFLLGPDAVFNDAGFEGFESEPVLKEMNSLFKDFTPVVTLQQKQFVLSETGIDDCTPAVELERKLRYSVLVHPVRRLIRMFFRNE